MSSASSCPKKPSSSALLAARVEPVGILASGPSSPASNHSYPTRRTAWARFKDPKAGLVGTATMVSARATSSLWRPAFSGPKRTPERSPRAAWARISAAARRGVITVFGMSRGRAVVA